ncbi:hypothetical protein D910_04796 [Dendroctonus ponderosae]|uniref:Uncharacterized protein n=1 Tax=Dendroctonus ponderosae TaxID=77166 RepID=U4U9Z5_DENPD|nr:hypothetical protein D910_04796 [Dendroctonus ponderosae]KAH1026173.1 hypothetical protein HUJ05_010731 [Dendroctonus ponderosae]
MVPLEDHTFNLPPFKGPHSAKMCFYRDFKRMGEEIVNIRILAQDAFRHQLECLSNMPGMEISEETVRELRALAYQGTDLKYHIH